MPDWILITPENVLEEFTPAESAALNNTQGSATSIAMIVLRVISEFRQAILDGGGQVAASGIPDGYAAHAIALARWRWLRSVPALKAMQTEGRKEAADKAEQLISDLATGKRRTAPPAIPADVANSSSGPRIAERPSNFHGSAQDGI